MGAKRSAVPEKDLRELQTSLERTQRELQAAYAAFNAVSDPDLTESCIYEIHALRARSDYLLRRIKGEGSQWT